MLKKATNMSIPKVMNSNEYVNCIRDTLPKDKGNFLKNIIIIRRLTMKYTSACPYMLNSSWKMTKGVRFALAIIVPYSMAVVVPISFVRKSQTDLIVPAKIE